MHRPAIGVALAVSLLLPTAAHADDRSAWGPWTDLYLLMEAEGYDCVDEYGFDEYLSVDLNQGTSTGRDIHICMHRTDHRQEVDGDPVDPYDYHAITGLRTIVSPTGYASACPLTYGEHWRMVQAFAASHPGDWSDGNTDATVWRPSDVNSLVGGSEEVLLCVEHDPDKPVALVELKICEDGSHETALAACQVDGLVPVRDQHGAYGDLNDTAGGDYIYLGARFLDGTDNLALGKPARQSTDYSASNYGPGEAVDGDFSSSSFTHTEAEYDPWWEVDLLDDHVLDEVLLYNRLDHPERLVDFRVTVYDEVGRVAYESERFASATGYPMTIPLHGVVGRTVRVDLRPTRECGADDCPFQQYLSLGEVVIRGRPEAPGDPALVGHWTNPGGARVPDSSGNAHDAVLGSGSLVATPGAPPLGGEGFELPSGASLEVAHAAALEPADALSVMAWVHRDDWAAAGAESILSSDGYGLRLNGHRAELWLQVDGESTLTWVDVSTLAPGWHHLAGAFDGTSVDLLVDGLPWYTDLTIGGAITYDTGAGDLVLGSGRLDDVRLYDRALGGDEIRGVLSGNLVARYLFRGDGWDEQIPYWDATVSAPYAADIDGVDPGAVHIATTGEYVDLPPETIDDLEDFTIAACVYLDAYETGPYALNTLMSAIDTGNDNGLVIGYDPGGASDWLVSLNGSYAYVPVTPTAGTWQHWAFSREGRSLRAYLNGVEQGTVALSALQSEPLKARHVLVGHEQDAPGGGLSSSQTLNGAVSDLRIYSRALSSDHIAQLDCTR